MTMAWMPKRAMVLAAGRGERLRPLTDRLPKPLIAIAGRSLLDRALDRLKEAGVEEVVVNLQHLGEKIRQALARRDDVRIVYSEEKERLETGGGIAKALPRFGQAPFFAVNGDVLWEEGGPPALRRLAEGFDAARMDGLLLVQPRAAALGYDGNGDFELGAGGKLIRRQGNTAPYVFTGIQLLHPKLFEGAPGGRFSMNLLYDAALAKGRLFGLVHVGAWYHIGTPEALAAIEERFRAGRP